MSRSARQDDSSSCDVALFSYLAHVETLYVDSYPRVDHGAEVIRRESFLAADGPIAGGAAASFGHRALLLSNGVADDPRGRSVHAMLDRWRVRLHPPRLTRTETPSSVVVCDASGGRTWFPHLPGVLAELERLELIGLDRAQFVYVDCYEILGSAARRVVEAGRGAGLPILANLGGSPLPPWLQLAAGQRGGPTLLQTSVAEGDVTVARALACELQDRTSAELAVVTAGSGGAVVRAGMETLHIAAPHVEVRQVQGVGSVFSAALVHGWLSGHNLLPLIRFACAAASLWCTMPTPSAPPATAEVFAFDEGLPR